MPYLRAKHKSGRGWKKSRGMPGPCSRRREEADSLRHPGFAESAPHAAATRQSQFPDPDFAVADGVVVVLQHQGLFEMGLVFVDSRMGGVALYLHVVLHQHAIVQDRDRGGFLDIAFGIEPGSMIDDVVGLPLAGFASGIYEGGVFLVNRAGLAVVIGFVVVGIEHLEFVTALQKDTAVPSALALAFDLARRGPFDVQLAIAKLLFSGDVPGAVHFHIAIRYCPPCVSAFLGFPL